MKVLKNTIEVLKLLDKSNCGECGLPACLAFATAVFKGQKQLSECPRLDGSLLEEYAVKAQSPQVPEQVRDDPLEGLKKRLAEIDLAGAAERLGEKYSKGKLTLKVCGKDFSVDTHGNFYSDIHIHSWITIPALNYILDGAGREPEGKWISFRELKRSKDWRRFFVHQCEKRIKRVADSYTDLFEDMLHIFNGKRVENHYESDISLVLRPLPRLPFLICYWRPDEGLESSLNLFFDSTASDNINTESIYSLGTGLATMFEKIALRHGN